MAERFAAPPGKVKWLCLKLSRRNEKSQGSGRCQAWRGNISLWIVYPQLSRIHVRISKELNHSAVR